MKLKSTIEEEIKTVTIESVKKGTTTSRTLYGNSFFRFPNKNTIYVADGYNRSTKKYSYYRYDDISHFGEKKKGTLVEIDFDF